MTAIEWTDITDNIIVAVIGGWWCRMISEGCVNCYAAKLNQSDYFGGNHLPYTGKPPELKLRTEIIDGWARMTKPKKHFVASMTDVFGDWVPYEWVELFLCGMARAKSQTFQVLTKRPDIAAKHIATWLAPRGFKQLPPNIWIGTSVENQQRADERIPELLKIPAKVRFLSVEPLLGPVKLERIAEGKNHEFNALTGKQGWLTVNKHIHWVICGGESGPNSRPCDVQWIRSIVAQCKAAGVSCFVKQLGAFPVTDEAAPDGWPGGTELETNPACTSKALVRLKHKKGGDMEEWPLDLRVRQFPKV